MQADVLTLRRVSARQQRTRGARRKRQKRAISIRAANPIKLSQPDVLTLFTTPQVIQSIKPAQQQTDDLIRDIFALAWDIGLKVWEPKWKKSSPGSLLVYKLSEGLAKSPSITLEAKGWLNLIKFGAVLYGLDK